jgi:hypothetical protein
MGNEVAQCCEEHKNMVSDWCLVDHLRGGTKAMRDAGETYLPKRPMEEISDWRARLCFATLFPAFMQTSRASVGRVFAEPLLLNDDVPSWIKNEVVPDVDMQGRNLHVWAREWFEEAFDYGLSHCIVDSPQTNGVQTREQQTKAGIRPYLIKIHPRNVLGWRYVDNVLTQLRVRFWREDVSGEFDYSLVEQVRVYSLDSGGVTVYVYEETAKDNWTVVETILTGLTAIPLVTLYTNRTGRLQAVPPMRELAYLNAKHWRIQSSNDTLVETASVPILTIIGGDDAQIVIGAKSAVKLPPGADMKFVEHTGAAIKSGKESLDGLVEEMRQIGAKLLAPQSSASSGSGTNTKTATQVSEEAARDNSQLGAMALQLEDTLNELLDVIASFREGAVTHYPGGGTATATSLGGTVKLQPNLDPDLDPNATMMTLTSLESASVISRQTLFERAQDMGLIPEDTKWEDEQERIKEDMLAMPQPEPLPGQQQGAGA